MTRLALVVIVVAAVAPATAFAPVAIGGRTTQLKVGSTEDFNITDPEPRTSNREALRALLESKGAAVVSSDVGDGLDWDDEVDYDAPHDPVKVTSGERTVMAAGGLPIVDDECYLGREMQFDDCVDFDPLPANAKAVGFGLGGSAWNTPMPDFADLAKELSAKMMDARVALGIILKK